MTAWWLATFLAPVALVTAMGTIAIGYPLVKHSARQMMSYLAPLAVLPGLGLAFFARNDGTVEADWLLLGTSVSVDNYSAPLLAMTSILYAFALIMVPRSSIDRAPGLSAVLLLSFVGNAGVFVAADLVTFYLSFTLVSFAGYALVIHDRAESSIRAGRVYMFLTVTGEVAVLAALMMIAAVGGLEVSAAPAAVAEAPHRWIILLMLVIGFGIKAGTVPLHVWLPLAHPAAPAPASAVLSGAMVVAGIVGWLRFLPLGEAELAGWGTALMIMGAAGAFLAVPVGLLHPNPKVVLAYSSISQFGFISCLIGAALLHPDLAAPVIAASVLYAVHHGIAKGALFIGVGLWHENGSGPARPFLVAGMIVAALAIIGAPLSSGYFAKYAAKQAVEETTLLGLPLAAVLPFVGTGSTLLLAKFAWDLMRDHAEAKPDLMHVGAWWVLIASSVPLTLVAGTWLHSDLSMPGWLELSVWWDQSWPVLLGIGMVALLYRALSRGQLPPWVDRADDSVVPAGDVVVLEEAAARRIKTSWLATAAWIDSRRPRIDVEPIGEALSLRHLEKTERQLERWSVSGIALMLTAIMLIVVWRVFR